MLGVELHGSCGSKLHRLQHRFNSYSIFFIGSKHANPQSPDPLHKAQNSTHRTLPRRNQYPQMRAGRYKRLRSRAMRRDWQNGQEYQ